MSPVNSFLDPLIFDLPTSSGPGSVDHTKLLEELDLWVSNTTLGLRMLYMHSY